MKIAASILLTICLILPLGAEKVTTLPDLLTPAAIAVDDSQIYITDQFTVFIYSKEDYEEVKHFGKRGEGPQEFVVIPPSLHLRVNAQTDHLIVNSLRKVSVFSKQGEYKNEAKASGGFHVIFIPLGSSYVGTGVVVEEKVNYTTVNIYDAELKKTKEIYRTIAEEQPGGDIKVLSTALVYCTHGDKIFVAGKKDFVIDVFDKTGKALSPIKQEYTLRPVDEGFKTRVMNHLKTDPQIKRFYDIYKEKVKFPETFPAINNMFVSDGKIYVVTHQTKDGAGQEREVYIFGTDGKLQKKLFLPIIDKNPIESNPYTIEKGKLYLLLENEDEEEWELFVTPIL
jgi:hypothetical protein